jgi:pilus assembly protein Flp/PilA
MKENSMNTIIAKARAYMNDESGATAIEYGLIAGGISLAIVAALFAFGDKLGVVFGEMNSAMDGAVARVQAGEGEGTTP